MKRARITLVTLSLLLSSLAVAHHGKKYFVTGSHEVSDPGAWHVLLSTEYKPRLDQQNIGIEPGILYGISKSMDVEFHSHHSNENGIFHLEAIAVESRLGLFGNYVEDEDNIAERDHESHFGMTLLVEFEKAFGHEDNVEGRFIVGGDVAATSYALNLIWQRSLEKSGSQGVGFALGLKRNLVSVIGIGIEVDGGFDNIEDFRWTPGIYISASEKLDLKIGASFGIRGLPGDQVVRTSLVLGF